MQLLRKSLCGLRLHRGDPSCLLTHRGEVFTPSSAWGRARLHSNLVFIGILVSFKSTPDMLRCLSLSPDGRKEGIEFLSVSLGSTRVRIIGDACEIYKLSDSIPHAQNQNL